MNSRFKSVLAACAFVALGAAATSAADLTIISAVKMGDNTSTSTQYLTAERARTVSGDFDTIVDYATGRIVTIDHRKKEYTETTVAEMAAFMQQTMAQMENMPGFMRKAMGGSVGPITVNKGTATRSIAGYTCTQYTLSMGPDFVFDLWVTPALEMPPQLLESQKAQYAAMGPAGRRFVAMFDEMKKIKGVALAMGTHYKMLKKVDTLSEATEVRTTPIPATTFAMPAGYKKKDSPFKR